MTTTRTIVLNFQVQYQRDIPQALHPLLTQEPPADRNPAPAGTMLSSSDGHRTITALVDSIQMLGFQLAFVRVAPKGDKIGMRFSFTPEGGAPTEQLLALRSMCEQTAWRARIYRNPAMKNGKLVPEATDINIALAHRRLTEKYPGVLSELDVSFL